MAGPAIRCVEIAKQLAGEFDATIYSPRPSDFEEKAICDSNDFHLLAGVGKSELYATAENSDVIFIQANVLKPLPGLAKLDKPIVVDLYDPYLMAILAQYEPDSPTSGASYNLMHKVLEQHMARADFSVCASERQRDYWLGRYCSLGRLTPRMYKLDRTFRNLIDVVPFGLPTEPAVRTGPGVKGVVPGIEPDDFLLLWGGGIWEWFDPLTVIKAVAELAPKHPRLKLYFMGFKSPNPQVPLMDMAVKAKDLALSLGVLDKNVFFSETWTSYEDRVNVLLDADVAVSAHFDLTETRFSFRTRILDYFWAGLPTFTTCGDDLAELIASYNAGKSLEYEDVGAWTTALDEVLSNRHLIARYKEGSKLLAQQYTWDKVVEPLRSFCRNPHRLPSHQTVQMPSIVDRAKAVYSRGGKDLVIKRSREILQDLLRG
jgi:glycosyltransferase involved in cell wall biosynthesis